LKCAPPGIHVARKNGENKKLAAMVEEAEFLRPIVIRLRGVLSAATEPEVQAVLRDVISATEERLAALNDAKLKSGKL
jgi:hypothetical protein